MSDRNERVECDHGDGVATFVCRHLRDGVACGYHCGDDDPDDRWPDAWCDACEVARVREGGWNDAAEGEADISLVCQHGYEAAKERNARIPPPLAPGALGLSAAAVRGLVEHASAWTRERQADAQREFDLGAHERWGADYAAARFTLGAPEHPTIVADLQLVGTFSKKTNSWLWSWNNEAIEPHLSEEVARLRALGEVRGIALLAQAYQENVEEVDAWERASLACYLLGHQAVYRAPMDHRFLFMLLKNLR
ncbi:MAG TPA: hypothetical protein VGQ83_43540, partial [Polyangia bacterium]